MNFVRVLRELHLDPFNPTVLADIVLGFLKNSKKAKPNFEWQSTGNPLFEVDLHSLPLTELLTPASYASNNTQIF
jgi:hypothetical protein